jgi:nucleotide-binding universal stress UspA family protein
MYKRLLVPTDGSELATEAVRGAVRFAKPIGASVVLITVMEPYSYTSLSEYRPESIEDYDERMRETAEENLQAAKKLFDEAGIAAETMAVKSFSPAEAIINATQDKNCDCVFMASHGRKGLAAVLLGSETQKVLTHSRVPVMVYR